ncbi:MAG: HAMP domain-containing sensor histidine kinase [Gemmatimonadota bacterium]|nr:HAMP domain-containing sensor histidine kinase [Gemmatimonadota bacterium]
MNRFTGSRKPRGRLPWLGILVPLGLGLVLALGLAYQTWDAARSHREAAEATVRDHAGFAAHLLAGRLDGRITQTMLYAFYRVDLNIRAGERWPPVEGLAVDQEVRRCRPDIPAEARVYFRWAAGELSIMGPADPGLRGWLEGWVATVAESESGRSFGLRFGAPGIGPVGVAYRVFRTSAGNAVYGLDNCLRDLQDDVVAAAVAESGLLPPTLVGETPGDSLYGVTLLNGEGTPVWGDSSMDYTRFTGRSAVRPAEAYDGLTVVLRLRESVAERLVVGGLPRSRLPETLGLAGLTALLLTIAGRQLRRGQELVRLREEFVANVSHELRTPLQQILIFTDLIRLERMKSEGERAQAVNVIHRETRRLIDMVENLLSFSRPIGEPGRPRDTAVLDLVTMVVESFRPIAEGDGVELDLVGDEVIVSCDPEALQRVLLNLLDNAVKYGPEGQTVTVEVSRRGPSAIIAVSDEGPGVPPDQRDRIWEAYVRIENGSRANRAGHGVGLAIVRELVERMGGTVGVEDAEPHGARFEIELPVAT